MDRLKKVIRCAASNPSTKPSMGTFFTVVTITALRDHLPDTSAMIVCDYLFMCEYSSDADRWWQFNIGNTMETVCRYGWLHIAKHIRSMSACIDMGCLKGALDGNHTDIVRWLLSIRWSSCDSDSMFRNRWWFIVKHMRADMPAEIITMVVAQINADDRHDCIANTWLDTFRPGA